MKIKSNIKDIIKIHRLIEVKIKIVE